ncbi:MAG: hypothetical protein WKG01_02860 [Kofleriaceae bacterium]
MRLVPCVVTLTALTASAHADEWSSIEPRTAQLISIGTTLAGVATTVYVSQRDTGEPELHAAGVGLATISIGPAIGLLAAGEWKRGIAGALARPGLVVLGTASIAAGALVIGFGCGETGDCALPKGVGGFMIGGGALLGAGALAWGIYDLWQTPALARRRGARVLVVPQLGTDRAGVGLSLIH